MQYAVAMAGDHHSDPESKLLECFEQSSCPILQEAELRELWKTKCPKDSTNFAEHLKSLVDSGRLGVRTLARGENEVTVYWLREVKHTAISKQTPIRTPGSARQPSKRSRAPFVSPLLKGSQQKRPKLDHTPKAPQDIDNAKLAQEASDSSAVTPQASAIDSVKGRLDFDEAQTTVKTESAKVEGESSSSEVGVETAPRTESTKVKGEGSSVEDGVQCLMNERTTLLARLTERKEELRKLRMVKMYRTKNDLQGLDELTSKWREVAQDAAQCLLESSTHQPRPSMQQLLEYLHIDPDIINYSIEDEAFY